MTPLQSDQVELTREVVIGGKLETIRVRFPNELLRYQSKEAADLIEREFADAIRNFRPATEQNSPPVQAPSP